MKEAVIETSPYRVRLSRKKGWKKPANTVVVARPSKWGNPFKVEPGYPLEQVVADYEVWVTTEGKNVLNAAMLELRGKNLACWCDLHGPCHADILLKLVN